MNPTSRAIELAGGPAKVAALLGVSTQAACFWRDGKRELPVKYGAPIEAASGVRRWELRPDDWHVIWPELVGVDGAPEVKGFPAQTVRLQRPTAKAEAPVASTEQASFAYGGRRAEDHPSPCRDIKALGHLVSDKPTAGD